MSLNTGDDLVTWRAAPDKPCSHPKRVVRLIGSAAVSDNAHRNFPAPPRRGSVLRLARRTGYHIHPRTASRHYQKCFPSVQNTTRSTWVRGMLYPAITKLFFLAKVDIPLPYCREMTSQTLKMSQVTSILMSFLSRFFSLTCKKKKKNPNKPSMSPLKAQTLRRQENVFKRALKVWPLEASIKRPLVQFRGTP